MPGQAGRLLLHLRRNDYIDRIMFFEKPDFKGMLETTPLPQMTAMTQGSYPVFGEKLSYH